MIYLLVNPLSKLHRVPSRVEQILRWHTKSAISQATVAAAPSSRIKSKINRSKERGIFSNARTVTSLQPLILVPDTSNLVLPDNAALKPSYQEAVNKHLVEYNGWKVYGSDHVTNLPHVYLKLSKSRLTFFVVMTTMAGYAIAPAPVDFTTLLMASVGTGLTSAAANAINQYLEVPYDSQMSRTRNRPLVQGQVTPLHAVTFATLTSLLGVSILCFGCNPLTAALGFSNLILYTSVYTPLKRMSILNTWVGSIVGALPPLMGWAACTGDLVPGAYVMAGILYAWQFPHFNALSWNLRPDYSRAGYRMMSVTDPGLCRRTALRYTGVITGLSCAAPFLDVTNYWFVLESLPLNLYFSFLAWQFYKESDSKSSRKLFKFSLIHLPALMFLLLLNKKYWYLGKDKEDHETTVKPGQSVVPVDTALVEEMDTSLDETNLYQEETSLVS